MLRYNRNATVLGPQMKQVEASGTHRHSFASKAPQESPADDQTAERRRFGRGDLSNPHLIEMARDPGGLNHVEEPGEDVALAVRGSLRPALFAVAIFWSGVALLVFR